MNVHNKKAMGITKKVLVFILTGHDLHWNKTPYFSYNTELHWAISKEAETRVQQYKHPTPNWSIT